MTINENLHTHTWRCKHASGDVSDYCEAAIEAGLSILGMSDHVPFPDNRWLNVRMHYSELNDYCSAVEQAKIDFPDLTIYKAFECEYDAAYANYYREELLGEHSCDYLICGAHYIPVGNDWHFVYGGTADKKSLSIYADYLINSMATGLFLFTAHPDLFGNAYLNWDDHAIACSKAILTAAEDLQMPIEINAYGLRKEMVDTDAGRRPMYPWNPFWELAANYNLKIICSSDAHRPEDIIAKIPETMAIAEKYNLTVIDSAELGL